MIALAALLTGLTVALLPLPSLAQDRVRALHPPPAAARGPGLRGVRRGLARRASGVDPRGLVVELLSALMTELRSGLAPTSALSNAVDQFRDRAERLGRVGPALLAVGERARAGHDPVPELHRAASIAGAEGLGRLAACWRVSARTGAALAPVIGQLGDTLRAEEEQRQELRAQLAGPRATSVLLAVLPAIGLAMGAGLSTRPLVFLLTTPAGLACLAVGITLEVLGLMWTRRIVRGALGRAALRPPTP
ncbi:type II secretion system F family protein [Spiractinospora alimapuensis]|uniref:type II secretion system F family protein n=1 Tax=Spiractinospora alimapuensis TaxID=2820884 RepID=UPI001F426D54|nr:type II secretion system F family protein [Spiractinospora alimapuensis]QVQ50360.1 type II secretion system F family protein [Spiractinospora alimapuensis]